MSTLLELELEDPVCESCGGSAKERVISTRDYETQISNHFDVSRCTNCGLVYTAPRPKFEDLLTHFYGNDYLCYESGLTQKLRTAYQGRAFMKKFRGIMYPGARLLEVGCASGDLLAYVKEHSDWSLYACEPKREIAEIARKRGLDVQPHTLAEADYQDDFFDVVYMSHVIEHVPDVRVTMEKVFRILKPGGLFITEHPDFGGPTRPFFGRYWWGYHLPRHTLAQQVAGGQAPLALGRAGPVEREVDLSAVEEALQVRQPVCPAPGYRYPRKGLILLDP